MFRALSRMIERRTDRAVTAAVPAVEAPALQPVLPTYPQTQVTDLGGVSATFYCPNQLCHQRAMGVLLKERDTIAWLSAMPEGGVFWDVGSNVGSYALYAALVRSAQVHAFEPSAFNYDVLNRNILLNDLSDRATAYCICVGLGASSGRLHMQATDAGAALHNFGDNIDYKGDRFVPQFLQGTICLSIDELVDAFGIAFPEYMKIDVDGLEKEIMRGGQRTFADRRFRSLLVEVNLNDTMEVELVSSIASRSGLVLRDDVPHNQPRHHGKAVRIQNMIFERR